MSGLVARVSVDLLEPGEPCELVSRCSTPGCSSPRALVLLAIPAGFVHGSSSSSAALPGPNGSAYRVQRCREVATQHRCPQPHRRVVVALVLLAFVSGGLGWFLAGRLLRPLRTITDNAREISASNLHRRLDLAGPDDEFKKLGLTLDDLFARLEASFEAQRRFVANASHELRTPLTAERTVLQVALADPDADDETPRAACQQVITLGEQQETPDQRAAHSRQHRTRNRAAASDATLPRSPPPQFSPAAARWNARLHAVTAYGGASRRRRSAAAGQLGGQSRRQRDSAQRRRWSPQRHHRDDP